VKFIKDLALQTKYSCVYRYPLPIRTYHRKMKLSILFILFLSVVAIHATENEEQKATQTDLISRIKTGLMALSQDNSDVVNYWDEEDEDEDDEEDEDVDDNIDEDDNDVEDEEDEDHEEVEDNVDEDEDIAEDEEDTDNEENEEVVQFVYFCVCLYMN